MQTFVIVHVFGISEPPAQGLKILGSSDTNVKQIFSRIFLWTFLCVWQAAHFLGIFALIWTYVVSHYFKRPLHMCVLWVTLLAGHRYEEDEPGRVTGATVRKYATDHSCVIEREVSGSREAMNEKLLFWFRGLCVCVSREVFEVNKECIQNSIW